MRPRMLRLPAATAILLAAAMLASCASTATVARAPAGEPANPDAVEAYLLEQMRINRIPSIAVAIVRSGRTELLRAWGTAALEWDVPATTSTAYQLASATKPLTGTALMLLVQEGSLALDGSVRAYLPEAPAEWDRITIRHLATHASGISDDLGDTASKTAADAARRLMSLPLAFEPGTRTSYGIGGYAVLQHIIERIAGMPFPQFLHERVFVPLGMAGTRFDHSADDGPFRTADVVPQRAQIYSLEGDQPRIFWFHYGAAAYSAGGLLATAEDLAKWAAALDSGTLLSDESAASMWDTAGQPDPDNAFAIGWAVGTYRAQRTVGHSGGPALADILRFPQEEVTIIVLTNQSTMYPYLAQGIADLVIPAPRGPAPTPIADTDTTISHRIQVLLRSLADGHIPDEAFTDEARRGFVPQIRTFLPPYTRSLGTPDTITLIDETTGDGRRERAYLVSYAGKPVVWRFQLAPDGRIQSMRPFPR